MLTFVVVLFAVDLPVCLYCAAMLVISTGYLTDPEDQPGYFRMFAWMLSAVRKRELEAPPVYPGGIAVAILGLGLANLVPIIGLIAHKNGIGPVIAELVYVVVVALWTANVIAAIRGSLPKPLPTNDADLSDFIAGQFLEPLAGRCARSGLEVSFDPEFVEWLKGKLASGEPKRPYLDRVGASALLESASVPGKYSATVADGSPVLVPRHEPGAQAPLSRAT